MFCSATAEVLRLSWFCHLAIFGPSGIGIRVPAYCRYWQMVRVRTGAGGCFRRPSVLEECTACTLHVPSSLFFLRHRVFTIRVYFSPFAPGIDKRLLWIIRPMRAVSRLPIVLGRCPRSRLPHKVKAYASPQTTTSHFPFPFTHHRFISAPSKMSLAYTVSSGKSKVLVFGAGNFGSCLADHLADSSHDVLVWSRSPEIVQHLNQFHRNPEFLQDHVFPDSLKAVGPEFPSEELIRQMDVLLFAIPTEGVR